MYVFIICIYSNTSQFCLKLVLSKAASDCQSNTVNSNKTLHRMLCVCVCVCVFTSIYCARCLRVRQ